jgi:hypothetical protein
MNSTTVTLVPNLWSTYPSSIPITPPPITINDSGIFSKLKAPVELTITFSSKSSPGKGVGSDPVAKMIFLLSNFLLSPLSVVT